MRHRYQVHWFGNMAGAADVVKALSELKDEGLIKHYGVCNFGASQACVHAHVCARHGTGRYGMARDSTA